MRISISRDKNGWTQMNRGKGGERRLSRVRSYDNTHGYHIFVTNGFETKQFGSLEDAQDAWDMCHLVEDGEQKKACYNQFGLDGASVEKYLGIVKSLEKSIDLTNVLIKQNEIKAPIVSFRLWNLVFQISIQK